MLEGITTVDRFSHPSKAERPTEVTDEGRMTEVRALQYEKAWSPTVVTVDGMFMEARD